jgi:hypothetical protein
MRTATAAAILALLCVSSFASDGAPTLRTEGSECYPHTNVGCGTKAYDAVTTDSCLSNRSYFFNEHRLRIVERSTLTITVTTEDVPVTLFLYDPIDDLMYGYDSNIGRRNTATITAFIPRPGDYLLQVVPKMPKQTARYFVGIVCTPCTEPALTGGPSPATITAGTSAILTVSNTGTPPFHYTWRNVADPLNSAVAPDSTTFVTPPLTASAAYFVEIVNGCGKATSETATVTVTPCLSPAITSIPAGFITKQGLPVTLSVKASGSAPLHYQWREARAAAPPPGTDSPTFTTPPLSAPASYVVTVSNPCGQITSGPIDISVIPEKGRAARH